MDPDSQRERTVTHGDAESQVTGREAHRASLTQAVSHRPVTHTVTPPPSDSLRHSPRQVSHSAHCAQLEPQVLRLLHPQPHTAPPFPRRTEGGLAEGPAEGTGTGTRSQTGQQPGGRPLRRGCQGNRLRRTNQELRFLTLIFRSWAWAAWAGQQPARLPWAVPEDIIQRHQPQRLPPGGTW